MSGLEDAARDARAHADVCTNPSCHATANALEGALAAARTKGHEPGDTTGIPSAAEAGYPACLRIPPGESAQD